MTGAGPRTGADAPRIHVLAGVLIAGDGRVLLAERPAGKAFAGRWEFPGGKLDPGETPRAALDRELAEELGIQVEQAQPLLAVEHRYPGAAGAVLIDGWRVTRWRGEPASLDGQRLRWRTPAQLPDEDILEADRPIVTALRLPRCFVRQGLAAPSGGSCARLGEPDCLLDPAATGPGAVAVYTTQERFRRAADAHSLAGRLIAEVETARAAAAAGADFLLVCAPALTAEQLAAIASLGLPWYLDARAAAATGATATGVLHWRARP